MTMDDPLELLRQANPYPDPSALDVPDRYADAALALPRRRRFGRGAAHVVAVVAVGAAAAAAAFVSTRQPSHTVSIGCYAEPRLDADTAVVHADDDEAPTDACAALWRDGGIGRGPVPPLQACTLPSGGIGVFPGGSPAVCQRLGRDAAPAPSPSTTGDLADLPQALAAAARSERCLAPDTARRLAREELDERGLDDWRITTAPGASGKGFDAERPCASFVVDEPSESVTLVPRPSR